jgi:predicted DNA repair protein MutK
MAAGILSVFDDVAALMDDVASASKIATRKTAGILGDDLAVNAEKATGFLAQRELPVLWKITKGSFLNKLIIIPVALLLSAFWPFAIIIILVGGGTYLAYEGIESIVELLVHRRRKKHKPAVEVVEKNPPDEKARIRSAILTDFVLSVEIVILALGTVLEQTLPIRILTVSAVSLIATVGVYGLVTVIVRMDDWGYRLLKRSGEKGPLAAAGHALLWMMPLIIKLLRIVGTVALLLVSGDIFTHNINYLHYILPDLPAIVRELLAGLVAGIIAFALVAGIKACVRLLKGRRSDTFSEPSSTKM